LTRSDAELEAGTRAHYEDVAYYTSAYARRENDVAYYVALGIEHGCRVLEYGCGNGRITIPTARAGVETLAVDRAAHMLADLKKRLADESPGVQARVRTRCGDMRALSLPERFGLVTCTFNTFLHLYDRASVERYLARVHRIGRAHV
jgi:SAM-dependent methyltransferase